jgi:hypothetical protein
MSGSPFELPFAEILLLQASDPMGVVNLEHGPGPV